MKRKRIRIAVIIAVIVSSVWAFIFLVAPPTVKVYLPWNPSGQCRFHNLTRNELAVVIEDNDVYNNPEVLSAIEDYMNSIEEDLGIKHIEVQTFPGKVMAEWNEFDPSYLQDLDDFIEQLYLKRHVGYIIFIGDFFETGTTTIQIQARLDTIGGEHVGTRVCRNVAISRIEPPSTYSDKDKTLFVINALNTYTNFHENPEAYMEKYKDKQLLIVRPEEDIKTHFPEKYWPLVAKMSYIKSDEHDKILSALEDSPYYFAYQAHADGEKTLYTYGFTETGELTSDIYLDFARKRGERSPFLIVWIGTCADMDYWAAIFTETGVLSVNTAGAKAFPICKPIGQIAREHFCSMLLYGDLFAYGPGKFEKDSTCQKDYLTGW